MRIIKNARIRMPDGVRLAADLFMPDGDGPFPAILEYLPYRKDDNTVPRLEIHHYFAERGFVGARVDIRGTGNSEGVAIDEYPLQEQLDALVVIEWLARQPWSSGAVGMFGSSWGGFNALQVAMHNPPQLKAIVAMYATDDRYNDDIHYLRGCVHAEDQAHYGLSMVSMNALPPYPEIDDWAEMWRERLERGEPWLIKWLEEQVDGPYWQHGSLKTDYGAIRCPTYLIGGWNDGYTNMCLRTYARLEAPAKVLIGPWTHARPDKSVPGPRIDYAHEMLRWFGHWLAGQDTGITAEPPIAIFVREYFPQEPLPDTVPGTWRFEPGWPLDRAREQLLYLGEANRLLAAPGAGEGGDDLAVRPTVGLTDHKWCAGLAIAQGLSLDQRPDEAHGLCYTTPPLDDDVEILGYPTVRLAFSTTAPSGNVCVRLTDVAPDGDSALVSRAFLNVTHRDSDTNPEPIEPGRIYRLDLGMKVTSWVFRKGHRIRLAIYGNSWPITWPAPALATHTIYRGSAHRSFVTLPVVGPQHPALPPPRFLPWTPRSPIYESGPQGATTELVYLPLERCHAVRRRYHSTMRLHEGLTEFGMRAESEAVASDLDPTDVTIRGTRSWLIERAGWKVEVDSTLRLSSTRDQFHVTISLATRLNGKPHLERSWARVIPRRLC